MEKELKPEEILLNLSILSQIRENEKISCDKENIAIDTTTSIFQPFQRFFRGDSRDRTILIITKIIADSLKLTDDILENETNNKDNSITYFEEDNSSLLHRFLLNMQNAMRGLENLRITYNNDIPIQSKITLLVEKLQMRVEKINRLLKICIDSNSSLIK